MGKSHTPATDHSFDVYVGMLERGCPLCHSGTWVQSKGINIHLNLLSSPNTTTSPAYLLYTPKILNPVSPPPPHPGSRCLTWRLRSTASNIIMCHRRVQYARHTACPHEEPISETKVGSGCCPCSHTAILTAFPG